MKLFLQTFSSHVSENSGNSLKLLNMFSSSVKNATTYVMLKNPDPDYLKHAKYFAGVSQYELMYMYRTLNPLDLYCLVLFALITHSIYMHVLYILLLVAPPQYVCQLHGFYPCRAGREV